MRTEIYQWMKKVAVFYILFTAVLHLIPDSRYERYVRSFMGLLLIFMLCTPVFSLFGKGGQWRELFAENYEEESGLLEEQELENLQEIYLQKSYACEIEQRITKTLQNIGIISCEAAVHIEGERMAAIIYVSEALSEEQERRVEDALWSACGIKKEEYEIQVTGDNGAAVGSGAAFGDASGSGGDAGEGQLRKENGSLVG